MKKLLLLIAMLSTFTASASTKEAGGPIISNVVVTLTDAEPVVIDASQGFTFSLTLGGNRTIQLPSNQVAGSLYTFLFTQDGTGSRVPAWPAGWKFVAGTPPVLSTGASSLDALLFVSDGTYMNFLAITKNIDSAPPNVPTGPAVAFQTDKCHFTWTDASTDETSFAVYNCQAFAPGVPCDTGPLTTVAAGVTTYDDPHDPIAETGISYYYAVKAVRGGVASALTTAVECAIP